MLLAAPAASATPLCNPFLLHFQGMEQGTKIIIEIYSSQPENTTGGWVFKRSRQPRQIDRFIDGCTDQLHEAASAFPFAKKSMWIVQVGAEEVEAGRNSFCAISLPCAMELGRMKRLGYRTAPSTSLSFRFNSQKMPCERPFPHLTLRPLLRVSCRSHPTNDISSSTTTAAKSFSKGCGPFACRRSLI